ncbi:MAG: CRISPR-associated endonuclease Cas2 [Verrucomicrobia bacterium]|nr:MAG: CRISPR-associated endonuclease Cas2 [Verrucomicrobiota bacterium]
MRMPRTRYLVSYDIADPRRLRRVARIVEGFGVRLQYSVFECALDDTRLARLKAALHPELNHEEDQVLFVSLGPSSGDASLVIESMGRAYLVRTRVTII